MRSFSPPSVVCSGLAVLIGLAPIRSDSALPLVFTLIRVPSDFDFGY